MKKHNNRKMPKVSNQKPIWMNHSLNNNNELIRKNYSLQQNILYSLPCNVKIDEVVQTNAIKLAKELAILTQIEFLAESPIKVVNYDFNCDNINDPMLSLYLLLIKSINFQDRRYTIQGKHFMYHVSIVSLNDNYFINIIQINNECNYARMGRLMLSDDKTFKLVDNMDIIVDCSDKMVSSKYMATNSTEYTKLFADLESYISNDKIPISGHVLNIDGIESANNLFGTIFSLCPHGYANDNVVMYLQDNNFSPDFINKYNQNKNIDFNKVADLLQTTNDETFINSTNMSMIKKIIDYLHDFDGKELFYEIPLLDFSDNEDAIIQKYAIDNGIYCNLQNPEFNQYYNFQKYLSEQRFGINFRKIIKDPGIKNNIVNTIVFTCPNYDTKQIDFYIIHNSDNGQYGLYAVHYENMENFNPIYIDAMYYYVIIDKEHGGYITFDRDLLQTSDIPLLAIKYVTETMSFIYDHPETTAMITEKHNRLFNKPKPDDLTNPDFVIRRIIRTRSMARKYIKENSSKESNKSVKYTLEEWGRRAHIRKLKDGREIYIKASQCHRHKPLSDIEIHLKL